jgi:hypothetical protein
MSIGAVAARVVGSALLVESGALAIAAAYLRWWPACRPFDFETPECVHLQDDDYDYILVAHSWVPVGDSAPVGAVSLVLLALAVLVVTPVLVGGRWRWLAWSLSPVLAVSVLIPAAATWLSVRSGVPAAVPGELQAWWVWVWGWPGMLLVLAVASAVADQRMWWRLLVVGCLAVTSPWGEFFIAPIVMHYSPAGDLMPWTGAVSGAALLVAGVALWPATWPPAVRDVSNSSRVVAVHPTPTT